MIKAVFFDMNETLLDLSKLKKKFGEYIQNDYVVKYWFTKLLHTSTIVGSIGEYKNFSELAGVVLENVFFEEGIILSEETKKQILGTFRSLDVYDDVHEALRLLNENDIRVIPVSNSSLDMMKDQLTNSGIINLTDAYYSVDSVERYKPFSEIYEYVAKEENINVEEIFMVATHDWDLFGAKKVGLNTAFIERKRMIYNPIYEQSDIHSDNLVDLIKIIIKRN